MPEQGGKYISPVSTTPSAQAIDKAVEISSDLAELRSRLELIDPPLAGSLQGKALIFSKTPWGTAIVGVIAYVAARYGIHLDDDTTNLIALLGFIAGSYLMRYVSPQYISGVFRNKSPKLDDELKDAALARASASKINKSAG